MKTFRLFSIAALALAMAACSSDDNTLETQSPAANGKLSFTATIATPGNGSGTRTVYDEQPDGTINVAWKVNDEIAAIVTNSKDKLEKTILTVSKVNADGSATITGDITMPKNGEETVDLIYPASIVTLTDEDTKYTISFDKISNGTLDGTLASIANNVDYRRADDCELTVSGEQATLTSAAKLESKLSILKLTLQDKDGNALSASKVAIAGGKSVLASATLTSAASEVYLPVPAASGIDIAISATKGSDTYYYLKKNVTLAAGKYYESTVKMAKSTDLSMVDNAGAPRSTMSTANCYMVHTAGDYKLPLVYGNAIKNGAANTAAWTGVSGQLETFKNHAGKNITDPWIKNNKDESDNDIVVTTAELLWQDAEGLITAVGIDGDYLTLTVGKDATTQEGNAVIAAKSGDDIVWSWHIWVTKETFADASLTTVATGSHNYKVTPVNLGWVPTDDNGKKGYAPYYQWGRKDAFIPGTGNANTNRTVYDISNTPVPGLTYTPSNDATIADNIKNPTTHYYNSSNKGPCNTTYYNMWDAQNAITGNIITATKKTVYDPCPAGFCVPTGNLFYFIGDGSSQSMGSAWDGTNKGATWDTSITGTALFFPASGWRNPDDGLLSWVGEGGYCWSASPNSSSQGHDFYFNLEKWYWSSSNRAVGFSVRAVAEE